MTPATLLPSGRTEGTGAPACEDGRGAGKPITRRPPRECLECGTVISRQSKSGLCRLHAMRQLHADPAYQAARLTGLRNHCATPQAKARLGRQLAQWRETMSEEQREQIREHGRRQVRNYLSRPDVQARSASPEARAAAIARSQRTRFGWCPPELRAAYDDLVHGKRIPAAEARQIIEAEIPGTAAHARREIASRDLATRLRDERRRMEAY